MPMGARGLKAVERSRPDRFQLRHSFCLNWKTWQILCFLPVNYEM